MKRIIPLLLILSLVAAACGDEDDASTTSTTADGTTAPAYVDSVEFLFLESYPVQVRAIVKGNLPTPCHEFAWEFDTIASTAPTITVYSTVDPEAVCAQVLEPFEETIDLGAFETGSYVLTVNGETYPFEI